MRRTRALAFLAAICAAAQAHAQDGAHDDQRTTQEMIEHSREVWRSPGLLQSCPKATSGEIVVCAPAPDPVDGELEDQSRYESAMDKAIRKAERIPGMPTNAAHLFAPPPCIPSLLRFCGRILPSPAQPVLIDLSTIPEPLTQEEAAQVFRAEDQRPEEPSTTTTAASANAP